MEGAINKKSFNRWIPVIASIAIQLCLGTAYVWGAFQKGIAGYLFNGNNANAALAFSILLAVLTFGGTVGGKLQDKYGPRYVVMAGGIIMAIGFFLASMITPGNGWMIWITYGVLGGFGSGMTYSTTIACCQKWFPDKRGMVTGIIVSALGFGGVVLTLIAESLMKNFGGSGTGTAELKTFFILSIIFLVVTVVGSLFIKDPEPGYKPADWTPPAAKPGVTHQDLTPKQVLKTPQFYLITITLMFAAMAGLMMIAFGKSIAGAQKDLKDIAYYGVLIVALFNSIGRLFWGWTSDKLGRKQTLLILLISTAVLILLVKFVVASILFFVLIAAIGFLYGGYLGTFPALTADYFGSKNMGMNYGMVLLGFGIGAVVSSFIAGFYFDQAKVFDSAGVMIAIDMNILFIAFIIASVASIIGALLISYLRPPKALKQ